MVSANKIHQVGVVNVKDAGLKEYFKKGGIVDDRYYRKQQHGNINGPYHG